MKYKNRKTGETFRHLAHAVNLDIVNPTSVIIFCPDDNEHSIFTMATDQFTNQFETICNVCENSGFVEGGRCESCYQLRFDGEMKNAA